MKNRKRALWMALSLIPLAGIPVARGEGKSARQWLVQIQAEAKAAKPDPEMEQLQWGAVMHFYKKWKPSAEQKPAWDAFEKFMKEQGESILEKIMDGKELTPEEAGFEWILRGVIISRGGARHLPNTFEIHGRNPTAVNKYQRFRFTSIYLGRMALKKGFSGLPLNEDDIAALREYNISLANTHGHAEVMPYNFGLSRTIHRRAGESFPNFYIKRFDAVIGDPSFSDTGGDTWSWTERLKPIGIERLLQIIDGFGSVTDKKGHLAVVPKAAQNGWAKDDDKSFIRLSDFYGKKPVVLFLSDTKDVFCVRWFPAMEAVHKAYRGQVDFYIINTAFDDWWTKRTFFGVDVDSYYGDYTSRANILKWSYMKYPNVSVPGLLDNDASSLRNAFSTSGGGGDFVILDTDGKVAYQSPKGKFYGSDCHDEEYWLNDLEFELRALLTNGGKYDKSRGWGYMNDIRKEMFQRTKDGIKLESGKTIHWLPYRRWPSGKSSGAIWFTGTITKMDSETHQIQVKIEMNPEDMIGYRFNKAAGEKAALSEWAKKNMEILEKWLNGTEADKTYVFDIDDSVPLFLNAMEANAGQFRVGDYIAGRYGFMPDVVKDPKNPDSKNFNPPKITKTPEGFTRVKPEHLRVSRPITVEASEFLREKAWSERDKKNVGKW